MTKMFVIITTVFIILHITVARDVVDSTKTKNSVRYDNDNLKKLMERIDQMEKNINKRLDQQDIRLDRLENNGLNMESNNRNMSMVMETIVEQQMVITAEIFTVSQTLPFCCCQYQNTTDSGKHESTTNDPGKIVTTTTELTTSMKSSCAEVMGESGQSGVYKIHVTNSGLDPFDVYCTKRVGNKETDGTWLIIQRRQDGSTDFNQGWKMYQRGFGDLNRNFWIGLDKLYALTNSAEQELWVQLTISNGTQFWYLYSNFSIGDETESYALKTVGTFKSSVPDVDPLSTGQKWSTYDSDTNDTCAERHKGAWWHTKGCSISHLNGIYGGNKNWSLDFTLVRWNSLTTPVKWITYAHMAIRPRQ